MTQYIDPGTIQPTVQEQFQSLYGNLGIINTLTAVGQVLNQLGDVTGNAIGSLPTIYNAVSNQIAPQSIGSGYTANDINSSNYVKGSTGWLLGYTGPMQLNQLQSGSDISIQQWTFSGTFSSTGSSTVAWTLGTLKIADGTTFSISAGNTMTMTTLTYIYFDKSASTTILQSTTTYSTANGANKILIAKAAPSGVSGTAIINDNFNSYTNGNLGGQGSWIADVGNFQVEGTVVNEGAKAVSGTGGAKNHKIGISLNDGTQIFYCRLDGGAGSRVILYEDGTGSEIIQLDLNGAHAGKVSYNNGSGFVDFGTCPTTQWFYIQFQWQSSNHQVRYNINGGAWTSYDTPFGTWNNHINYFEMQDLNLGGTTYFDTLQGNTFSGDATFQVFGGSGGISINNLNIAQGSITGNLIAANTIAASNLIGTDISTVGTITTGKWNATVISPVYGGTGIANNSAMTVTGSGNFAYTRTLTGTTNVTFPTTGTLATLAGAESLTNKKLGSLTTNGFVKTSSGDGTLSVDTAVYSKVVASTFEKSETGADANVLTYTVGGSDALLEVLVAVDVSSFTATSLTTTVSWKDSNNSTQTTTLTLSGATDGTIKIPINAFASSNVVVSTSGVGIVSIAYNISAFITKLN